MILLKVLLTGAFSMVFLQDNKERQVYWFLFPVIGILCGFLFYKNTLTELFLNAITINILFITLLVLTLLIYAKYHLKTSLLKVIGVGDLLLFIALTFSFSTISFIVLFICALFFSLIIHLYKIKVRKSNKTIPLAGYISLFFLVSYVGHWLGLMNMLYTF